MANDLSVSNIGPNSITIQTIGIASGASYVVPFANVVAWAKDPYLRSYILGGICKITVLGTPLNIQQGYQWLNDMVLGNIVYAS